MFKLCCFNNNGKDMMYNIKHIAHKLVSIIDWNSIAKN